MKLLGHALALFVSLALVGAVVADDPSDHTWVRLAYRVDAGGGVPVAHYTVIEKLTKSRSQRSRVLLESGKRRVVVELKTKETKDSTSRWAEFRALGEGESLSIALIGGFVELRYGGKLVLDFELDKGLDETSLPAAVLLRSELPDPLMGALDLFVRVGLGREPAFADEARILADALFPHHARLALAPSKRHQVLAIMDFDPAKHAPSKRERAFGDLYGIPGLAAKPSPEATKK